jgi:hypothetical protein
VSDFSVTVSEANVNIELNEHLPKTDVMEMLRFDENDIDYLLRTHSGNQSYWDALAIRLKIRYEKYKEIWVEKWWAYHRIYAKNVLAAYGDPKPTLAALQDQTILVYSCEVTEEERKKYCSMAFSVAKSKAFHGSEEDYAALMYRYLRLNPPWYFETLVENTKRLQEEAETVQVVANKMNSKSFHLDTYAKMHFARKFDGGALTEKQLLDSVQGKGR